MAAASKATQTEIETNTNKLNTSITETDLHEFAVHVPLVSVSFREIINRKIMIKSWRSC